MNLVTASIVVAVLAVCATAKPYENELAEEMYQSAAMEGFMKIMKAYLTQTPMDKAGVVVDTTHGKVRGSSSNGAQVFKTIEFARAGRWKDPETDFKYKQEITDATEEPPMCPQKLSYLFPNPVDAKPYENIRISEDCLYLNVFTPKADPNTHLPVMVYIYGGAFIAGYSGFDFYDSTHLVKERGVVVVTFNYRVGALGFLKYGGVLHGNYGYLDQLAALEWVRDNIGNFGGDPNQVTLWGQSAGGMSVAYHLTREESKPLFNKAIIESDPFGFAFKLSEDAEERGNKFAKHLECSSVEELRELDADKIVDEQLYVLDKGTLSFREFLQWSPIVENMDEQPITMMANNMMHPYPIIMGTTSDDGRMFVYGVMKASIKFPPWSWTNKEDYLKLTISLIFGELEFDSKENQWIHDAYSELESYKSDDIRPVLSDIISDFVFICPVQYGAQEAKGNNKLYLFNFDHHPSWAHGAGCDEDHVCHGDEIAFVFGTVGMFNATEEEKALSKRMTLMWTNFAKTGDPNSDGNPTEEEIALSKRITLMWTNFAKTDDPNNDGNPTEEEIALSKRMILMWTNFAKTTDPNSDSINWPVVTDQKRETIMFDVGQDKLESEYQADRCDVWNNKLDMHVY